MADLVKIARKLRRDQTDAEKLVWGKLRNGRLNNYKFRRQHPVPPYIVDFFCEEKNIVIEIDGGQHNPEVDGVRDAFLSEQGYKIIRFWNNDVLKNIEGVLTTILMTMDEPSQKRKTPHPPRFAGPLPLPKGEGNKRICLGKIVSAHGVKGLVKILPFGGDVEFLESLGPLYKSETDSDTLSITLKNSAGNKYWLAAVAGVTERNGAEALRGTELWAPRDKLPEAEEGAFYFEDLIGLKAHDEQGAEIGEIIAVQNFGAGDLLEIQPRAGGDSFYLPFTKTNVPAVTDDAVTVNIPEGLL